MGVRRTFFPPYSCRLRDRVQGLAVIAIEDEAQTLVIELAHPPRNDDGREYIAEEVGDGANFRHEALDPEQQREAADRQNAESRDRRSERDKAGASDTGRTLRGEQHNEKHRQLLADRQMKVDRLGDEQ